MYTSPFLKKDDFPKIKKENQGKFTSWAKENGFKDACSGASAVMGNKEKYKGLSRNLRVTKRRSELDTCDFFLRFY